MLTHPRLLVARIAVAAMFLVVLLPGASAVAAQSAETSYTDEEYGVTVSWTDQWVAELPTAESSILHLERDSSVIVLISILDGRMVSPEDAVWFLYGDGDEIVEDRSTENPPHVVVKLSDASLTYTSEAYSVNDGEATVLVSMGTVPVLQESAVDIVKQDVSINGTPALAGQPLDGSGDATASASPETNSRTSRTPRGSDETTDVTEEATEESGRVSRTSRGSMDTIDATAEATEESGRTSRTSRGADETPEVTEEATTEITRTSRSGSGAAETPEATEEATVEPTEEVEVTDNPGEYTGTVWGYSFTYDTDLWELSSTYDNPTVDGIRLDGDSATVAFMGLNEYGADPVACLIGENEYYGSDTDMVSNWEVATDANGDQLWYEGDELAWGVFSYTFHSSSGVDVEFVDYISCETIPGEDAVLVVQMTSFPEDYNSNLDAVLDILDTLEFEP